MSATTKTLLAAALTLPLVAFVAGVLASPAEVEEDRSRPVIIGRVSDDDSGVRSPRPDGGRDDRDDRTARDDRDDPREGRDDDDDGPTGDDGSEDPPEAPATEPFTVVTPAPRDLDGDDDGGDDDDDDGDAGDDTDDESGDD